MREIVLVDCPDEVGLIHRITGVLERARLNIESNHEFVDPLARHFFFRAEVAATTPAAPTPAADLRESLAAVLPRAARVRVSREERRPLVVLASREPHCLGELLLLDAVGELPGRIVAVVSNHDALRELVARFSVPFHHVPVRDGAPREEHEAALEAVIDPYAPAYLVLARYMRVLSPAFVGRRSDRIVNIHHSFLPAFAGASPYRQAFARGVKLIGATAHFVTAELDAGPIIAQDVGRVTHRDTVEDFVRRGRELEVTVLASAVAAHLEHRIIVAGDRTIVFS